MLKRWEDDGRPPEDLPLVHWACRAMLYNLQERLHSLLRNFPNPVIGGLLRVLVFPMGRQYSAPSDATGREVAELLLGNGRARQRLCAGIYAGRADGKDHVGLLAEALDLAIKAEPVELRLRKAQKDGRLSSDERGDLRAEALAQRIIDDAEGRMLLRLDQLMREIVSVDHFDPRDLQRNP